MDNAKKFANDFIEYVNKSVSTHFVINNAEDVLVKNGFEKLETQNDWTINQSGKYYVKRTDTTIVAFTIGKNINIDKGIRVFGSHTDSPALKIKPNPEMQFGNIIRLNTEVYGGPILNTWLDRPLSLAGKLLIKSDDVFNPEKKYVNLKDLYLTIPNLAIHQNREVNKGYEIDKQNDLPPILQLTEELEHQDYLINYICSELKIEKETILGFELELSPVEKGCLIGVDKDILSCPKIDNLASVYAGLVGLVESKENDNINFFVGFDNEEVGSSSKQGADSTYFNDIMERVFYSLGYDRAVFLKVLASSFSISADGAHATHPAHANKSDPTNKILLNKGIAIKINTNQKYASDGESIAIVKQIMNSCKMNYQTFVNNSRELGGSTIGSISSSHTNINTVDIGMPILAMHSIREVCGIDDLHDLKELAKSFFEL